MFRSTVTWVWPHGSRETWCAAKSRGRAERVEQHQGRLTCLLVEVLRHNKLLAREKTARITGSLPACYQNLGVRQKAAEDAAVLQGQHRRETYRNLEGPALGGMYSKTKHFLQKKARLAHISHGRVGDVLQSASSVAAVLSSALKLLPRMGF